MQHETDSDVDLVVLESLDFEVPCLIHVQFEYPKKWGRGSSLGPVSETCTNPARWMMRCRACSGELTACEPHRVQVVAVKLAECMRCHATASQLFEIKPLPGGHHA